jgi:hypothetical protein
MMKKGQLTVFIIIGLILLVSAGLVLYLTTQRVVKPIEEEIIVPEDVRPVYEFVQGCANDAAREGLGLLGLQGGFIRLPGIIERTPTAYIQIDTFNAFKVPLWYYEGEDRTPSLGYMEREISRYVNERLKECTGAFEPFQERFAVVEQANATTRTMIADNEVILRISWPLALTMPDRTTRIQDFVVRMPVRLKQMWEVASAIMAAENERAFFENATIDLMAADTDHIPTDGFTIECGVKRWRLSEVQDRLQRLLYYHIPTTRIQNTNYFPFAEGMGTYETLHKEYMRMGRELNAGKDPKPPKITAPDDAYQYFKFFYDVGMRPTDLRVGFEYQPAWGMQLNAQPNEGPVLKSNSGKGPGKFLRFLCINQWHFAYDVIYYVKASVRDDKAFGGEGFVFQFAFPVLINDNAPERLAFGQKRFQSLDFGAPEFCTTYGDRLVEIRALGAIEGVQVLMELPDVAITYACFDQECELGSTTAEEGMYKLTRYLPRGCANPLITATKEGYLPATKQALAGEDRIDLELKKLQDMELKFVVHPYHGQTQTWGQPRPIKETERVSLQVSMINATFDQFLGFPTTNETLQLVQDTAYYDIDALLFLRENQIGGYNAAALRIPYSAIEGKTTAVIRLVEYLPVAITDEQRVNMISYIMEGDYRDALQPTFE